MGSSRHNPVAISDISDCYFVQPSSDSFKSDSFSRAVSPLRSTFAVPPCAHEEHMSCRGFRPSSRRYRRCPLIARDPDLTLCSVLRFSQPLDGLLHLPASWACFIPQPRPGFSPFRGFSRIEAVLAHRQALPPCRFSQSAHRRTGCHGRLNRLRGFSPRFDAFLRVGV